ncbi:cation:proton antiporter regulatory subunit [Salinibacillus xinjiangensis]|uniref:Potassium transporter TrkA n=1 Tax=Salinibacillus xinjiangensis TaxID=1229268 RepID=A0A6G1X2S1_9BACI|nr:cation:proton antiporter regulatory subunit [Salinibacillus xinjiangensis]MRG85195.1 potassium transporter TrkA [Salinibacillus xinjiangensis]
MNVSVSQLPGIGQKIEFKTAEDSMLVLIVHHTGKRELYFFEDADSDEADFVMDLTGDETRELGAQLLGATYQPVDADKLKMFKNQIVIDWVKLKPDSPLIGKTLEESEIRNKTGATVMGIIQNDEIIAAPGPDNLLTANDVLMIVGKKDQVNYLEAFCKGED